MENIRTISSTVSGGIPTQMELITRASTSTIRSMEMESKPIKREHSTMASGETIIKMDWASKHT